jgi:hypothetical protein
MDIKSIISTFLVFGSLSINAQKQRYEIDWISVGDSLENAFSLDSQFEIVRDTLIRSIEIQDKRKTQDKQCVSYFFDKNHFLRKIRFNSYCYDSKSGDYNLYFDSNYLRKVTYISRGGMENYKFYYDNVATHISEGKSKILEEFPDNFMDYYEVIKMGKELFKLAPRPKSQGDSLELKIISNYKPEDEGSYNIRVDFISKKHLPVNFILKPHLSFVCYDNKKEPIGIEIEKLDSAGYTPYNERFDCEHYRIAGKFNPIWKTLNNGDTISFSDQVWFEKYSNGRLHVFGFVGQYRIRVWRLYYDHLGEHKIYSNWNYIAFPKR